MGKTENVEQGAAGEAMVPVTRTACPQTRRDRASDEHLAFSSSMMGAPDAQWHRWTAEIGGVRVEVHTDRGQWPAGEDWTERIAFERDLERALRRLVGPMKSAVQGSMFDEVTDDD